MKFQEMNVLKARKARGEELSLYSFARNHTTLQKCYPSIEK
jgi:hypothetical protein